MKLSDEVVLHSVTSTDRILVIMAKAPRLGRVKTRLAEGVSPEAVTELYECLLNDTIALASKLKGVEIAIMCPAPDVEELSRSLGTAAEIVPQRGEGLAAGLTSVFTRFATAGRRVIAFNSDSPHLPPSVLEHAFDSLARCDLVVGPTHDGGYYLVGARASYADLFANDGMGTANALESLLARASLLDLIVRLTDPFYDVDVMADLSKIAEELRHTPSKAPRTARWLRERAAHRVAGKGSA
jgi:rSAM/selenodomain-associated transferase 1